MNLKNIKNMFRKPVTMPVIEVTPAMMIAKANGIVDSALHMFTQAVKDVEKANVILDESTVKNDAKEQALQVEIDKVRAEKESAELAKKANLALKEKLSQFTK